MTLTCNEHKIIYLILVFSSRFKTRVLSPLCCSCLLAAHPAVAGNYFLRSEGAFRIKPVVGDLFVVFNVIISQAN